MMSRSNSERLFSEAKAHLVGGVNSPVRSYRGFDFAPPFITKASGSHIWDADGNEYVDYVCSWGAMILGHAHPEIIRAIKEAAEGGTSYGAPTEWETELARLVKDAFPSCDLIRFVNSGTEAVMGAVRAARGFTHRDRILKFSGCYHGHADFLLVKAGSGAGTFGEPDSAGVPRDFARHTLVAEYNDLDGVQELVDGHKDDLAAIIVEPIAGNMGCVPPEPGFLEGLRDICNRYGIVLIFDEVITGFRVAFGGAQEIYGVRPNLTCLGKILGGGLPIGAYGGRREIMEAVSPIGPVYQAGTLSGNPLAVSAGLSTLKILRKVDIYPMLDRLVHRLTTALSEVLSAKGVAHTVNRVGSIYSIFFTDKKVRSYKDAISADRGLFDRYFVHMLDNGIYLAPSPFESSFVNSAHSGSDIEKTIDALNGIEW